ncbi:hypothetical protein LTR08_003598 [Meristemomyces frigidus]|nr:hypothetical protein LTR08_003598 [Meristemomyces frigidus]
MSIWRGAQSAIFYYLSCAPCADARVRKQRKREAVRDRADKTLLEQEFGGPLYRQPSPSATNPHWQAEIAMGPTMTRGKRKTNTTGSQRGLKGSAPQSSNASNIGSSVSLSRKLSGDKHDSKLELRRYQRDDEELWGSEVTAPPLRNHLEGSGGSTQPTKPRKARTKDTSSYQLYRNPQISDLHPAVATKIHSRDDVAWMLQPPPVANVMSGKERPPRSRSGSGSSRPTTGGGRSLSRQVSSRLIDQKMRNGEVSAPMPSCASSGRAPSTTRDQRVDASNISSNTEHKALAPPLGVREKRRPSPIQVKHEASNDFALTVIRNPSLAPEAAKKVQSRNLASRPQLPTVLSDSLMPSGTDTDFYTPAGTPKENGLPSVREKEDSSDSYDKTARKSALLVKEDSLKLLQHSAPNTLLFNEKIFQQARAVDSKARLPAHDGAEEPDSTGGAELYDTWHEPDFSLDKWVHEHTKREVRQRWSMDL